MREMLVWEKAGKGLEGGDSGSEPVHSLAPRDDDKQTPGVLCVDYTRAYSR